MFLTTQTPLVSIFVFSCFSYLEQFGNMFQAIEQGDVEIVSRLLWHGVHQISVVIGLIEHLFTWLHGTAA